MTDYVERNIAKRNQRFKDLKELEQALPPVNYQASIEKVDAYIKAIYEDVDYTKDPSEAGWPPKLEAKDFY